MADRIIRESIAYSISLAQCSLVAYAWWPHFIRITDNYGRFHANPELLVRQLAPQRTDLDPSLARECLEEYVAHGMASLYVVQGQEYAYLTMFDEYQTITSLNRQKPSRFPDPPLTHEHALAPRHFRAPKTSRKATDKFDFMVELAAAQMRKNGIEPTAMGVAKAMNIAGSGSKRSRIKDVLDRLNKRSLSGEICPESARPVPGPCPEIARSVPGPCPESARSLPGVCPESARPVPGPCPDFEGGPFSGHELGAFRAISGHAECEAECASPEFGHEPGTNWARTGHDLGTNWADLGQTLGRACPDSARSCPVGSWIMDHGKKEEG